ncbi:MAG: hypothetical protein UT86_C0003G0119 [Candidatus Magasanikbacteria bacterium GW2011_GWC2_40_17]|uniref:Uncharacterized protein n=1 Tax=Candidatus Magasanikbacteria bacterium GW2011_GWA2_42_32 TaxID=1619039 RepID=A0A0G1A7J4_9BACT|nr:MAG: hypothetical protein UT86_C0003G0119 [Candidatus Magasanikbacteria bacterium GW2011_GWC2_40_17]KKS57022.1 MAG: hypothetical protein UV20_C0004G0118 [Candidatus Magasanikbacteria bacterium GW2011_GWA2_42_32]
MSKISKIVYGILILLLVFKPHFSAHLSFLPKPYEDSIVTVVILGILYLIYFLNKREIEKREIEKINLACKIIDLDAKLSDSFTYIGQVNLKLPLLKNLTTDLLIKNKSTIKEKKEVFNNLLSTAVSSIAQVDWGMLRFIETDTGRTLKEYDFTVKDYILLKTQISNKDLVEATKDWDKKLKKIKNINFVTSSDSNFNIRCYLIFPEVKIEENNLEILQVIVDQSQLFYRYLY